MHFSFKGFISGLAFILLAALPASISAQETPPAAPVATPQPTPQEKPVKPDKNAPVVFTADQIAEGAILIYGGRASMGQIKRTTMERGKIAVTVADGTTDNALYEKRIIRGENIEKDKWRIDQRYPSVEFALVYNAKIFGLLNAQVFTPRQDAISAFEAQMLHGLDALLRYKENGSKLELGEKQKSMGVEYYVLDVIDKNDRKTRFYISTKSLRVMSLEYTVDAVKHVRKFHDYRYAQGMLVPYRSVLLVNDKQTEETWISTVTYGQRVEESYFTES